MSTDRVYKQAISVCLLKSTTMSVWQYTWDETTTHPRNCLSEALRAQNRLDYIVPCRREDGRRELWICGN